MQDDRRRLAVLAHDAQEIVEGVALLRREIGRDLAIGEIVLPLLGAGEEFLGCRIGIDDAQRCGIQHEHRLVRDLEQMLVAGLEVAQLPVVALHLLLRRYQARLQLGDGPEALADGHQAALGAEPDGRVLHRHFEAAGEKLRHLTERRDAGRLGVLDHAADLVATDAADCLFPTLADPTVDVLTRHLLGHRRLLDHAVGVHQECHIGLRGTRAAHRVCLR